MSFSFLLLVLLAISVAVSALDVRHRVELPKQKVPSVMNKNNPTTALPEFTPILEDLLSFNFYHHTCPGVEAIIYNKMKEWFKKDYTIAAALIRLHFHDCAVRVRPLLQITVTFFLFLILPICILLLYTGPVLNYVRDVMLLYFWTTKEVRERQV